MLDSLLEQTCGDWCCIVVDDCSSDATNDVVLSYKRSHPNRFKLISGEGSGPFFARLTGAKSAVAEWIMFCDADDVLLPDAMEKLLLSADNNVDMVVGNVRRVFPDGKCESMSATSSEPWPERVDGKWYAMKVFGSEWLMSTYGKLIRRSAFGTDFKAFEPYVMTGALEDGLMMMVSSVNMKSIVLLPDVDVYEFITDPCGPMKGFIPGANEFSLFCSSIIDFISHQFSDEEKAEVALYLSRLAYVMLIARGVKIDSNEAGFLRLLSALATKSRKAEYHDKEIYAMMRVARLRRAVARRHTPVETHLRPFISVIVSAYNVEDVVERSILSVTQNNLFHRFEVIVVDDCSTDSTASVVERLAAYDKRIKLVRHNKNMGLNATRLTGLSRSTGEWVMFLDAGDRLLPDLLTDLHSHIRMRREISGYRTDCVFFGIKSRSSRLPIEWTLWRTPEFKFDAEAVDSNTMFPQLLRKQGMPSALWNKVYRRQVLLDASLEAEAKFYGEDHLTTLKIFSRDFRCTFIDRLGYVWYTGGGSHKSVEEQWESECDLAKRTIELLKTLERGNAANISLLAESLRESLLESLARLVSAGVRDDGRLQSEIEKMTSKDVYQDLLKSKLLTVPIPAEVKAHYTKHRKAFIAKRWL